MAETRPSASQVALLQLLVSQAQAGDKRFDGEVTLFAEGLVQKCGHNKLEALGIQWRQSIDGTQRAALSSDSRLAADFAPYLYSRLIGYLSPDEEEISTLSSEHVKQCVAGLRMGIQGLIRWRASLADRAAYKAYPPDITLVTEALCPVIRSTADDFFASRALAA